MGGKGHTHVLHAIQALHKLGRQQEALEATQQGHTRAQRAAGEGGNSKEAGTALGVVAQLSELQSRVQHAIKVDNATPVTARRPQQQQQQTVPLGAGKGGAQQPKVVDIQDIHRQVAAAREGEGQQQQEEAPPHILLPGSKPSKRGSKSQGPLIQVVASSGGDDDDDAVHADDSRAAEAVVVGLQSLSCST
jgi:hypothetical protein